MKYAPLEIKQIACMIIVLKKSEKILVALGFDLGTSPLWGKHAATESTLHHAIESKFRTFTSRNNCWSSGANNL